MSNDLDVSRFQNMVNNLVAPHCVSFSAQDDMYVFQPQNSPLHIEVFIHRNWVKRALVNCGASINICTLSLVKALRYKKDVVDPRKKITIKAYDDEERSSKGMVILPIRVGPVVKETICKVLDLQLTYNILLGRPWIHDMQSIPST